MAPSLVVASPDDAIGDLVQQDNQIEWRGMLMGPGSFFGYKRLSGWEDLPNYSTNFVDRPRAHGAFAGPMFANERIVTFETQMYGGSADLFNEQMDLLEARTGPSDVDEPLVIRTRGRSRLAYGRITGRVMPVDRRFMQGYPVATIQWTCADPRRYDAAESFGTVSTEQIEGGLNWGPGLDWGSGLDWGMSLGRPQIMINNLGNVDSPIVATLFGELSAPFTLRSSVGWKIEIQRSLNVGETQTIDARDGTLKRNGVSILADLATSSDALEDAIVPPGVSTLRLETPVPNDSGRADVRWRSAYI